MRPAWFTGKLTGSSIGGRAGGELVRRTAAAGTAAAAATCRGHRQRREVAPGADGREAGDLHPCPYGLTLGAGLSSVSLGERGEHLELPLAGVAAILVDRHRDEIGRASCRERV